MLQERADKQAIDYMHPTKGRLFLWVQKECFRRGVIPFFMYVVLGNVALVCQLMPDSYRIAKVILASIIFAGAAVFNGYLIFQCGEKHYDNYLTGEMLRRDERLGIPTDGKHHLEGEYRPYKGFLVGLYAGLLVIPLSLLSSESIIGDADVLSAFRLIFLFLASWAYLPISWLHQWVVPGIDFLLCMPFILLPVLVSGFTYIAGALFEKKRKQAEKWRSEQVKRLQEEQERRQKEEAKRRAEQRGEQRKKK